MGKNKLRVEWMTQYMAIAKIGHDIMFQNILDFLHSPGQVRKFDIKKLSRRIKNEAWLSENQPLEVYKKYYISHGKYAISRVNRNYRPDNGEEEYFYVNLFEKQIKLARMNILWEVQLWTRLYQEQYDKMMGRNEDELGKYTG